MYYFNIILIIIYSAFYFDLVNDFIAITPLQPSIIFMPKFLFIWNLCPFIFAFLILTAVYSTKRDYILLLFFIIYTVYNLYYIYEIIKGYMYESLHGHSSTDVLVIVVGPLVIIFYNILLLIIYLFLRLLNYLIVNLFKITQGGNSGTDQNGTNLRDISFKINEIHLKRLPSKGKG